jgi:hypothetical protein
LNQTFLPNPALSAEVIRKFEEWSMWLISKAEGIERQEHKPLQITSRQAGRLGRIAVDAATNILHEWQTSALGITSSQRGVHLILGIADACSRHRIRVSFSTAAQELGDCVAHKALERSESEFNLAMRGLISLASVIFDTDEANLGIQTTINVMGRALADLGSINTERAEIAPWVLNELHEISDILSLKPNLSSSAWKQYLASLSVLRNEEIVRILSGPVDSRRHQKGGYPHSSWQSTILEELRTSRSAEMALAAQSAAVSLWIKCDELSGVVGLFESLTGEYLSSSDAQAALLVGAAADSTLSAFVRNPVVSASIWRRKVARQQRRQRAKVDRVEGPTWTADSV